MKQKLILLALVMGLTIVSQSSLSLGMGKIQVYSALNEPLQSSIELLANADEDLQNLEVKLASSEDYQKVGLDKSFVPANIMVAFDEENPLQINVTSNGPVIEPIVSLLLDVNWNNGRILREFTILLDPPAYESINTMPQVNDVIVEPIQDSVIEEPIEDQATTMEPETEVETVEDMPANDQVPTYTNEDMVEYEETAADADTVEEVTYNNTAEEVYVEAGDTLWRIANNNKAGGLSAQQMMMAIYNKNPNAFIDNNINQLIKGSRLDMPSSDEVSNIGFTEAMNQVESHRQSWSPAQPEYNTYQTEEATESDDSETESTLDYGVQLSGGDNEGSDDGQSNSDTGTDANAQALEEDLYNKDAENTDLKERISELENIVEQQQDVLEIDDDSLANLENQLENAADETEDEVSQAADEVADDATDLTAAADDIWDEASQTDADVESDDLMTEADALDDTALAEQSDDFDSESTDGLSSNDFDTTDETLAAETDVNDVDEVEEPAESDTQITPVTKKPIRPVKQESMVDKTINWVMDNLMWVLIGVVALIVLLFIPKMLGGRGDEDEDETSFLDDIKNRNKAVEEEHIDDVETKMNKPLVDEDNDEVDVLADLDGRIDFDDTDDEVPVTEELNDEDEITELSEEGEFETVEEDGFDLDGFLNDDDSDDITTTKDHSATMAGVNFDDEEEDLSFDDLDLDDAAEELSDDVDDAIDDFKSEVDDKTDEVSDEIVQDVLEEKAEAVDDISDEFSFDDDEDFDFNLDEELEELEQSEEIKADDSSDDETKENDEFNDMLDISDEDSETFEIDDEANVEEEIDLGLEDLMDDADAIGTKLDLAKAYIDMGDTEGAKNLLDEVIAEGNDAQTEEAKKLLDDM